MEELYRELKLANPEAIIHYFAEPDAIVISRPSENTKVINIQPYGNLDLNPQIKMLLKLEYISAPGKTLYLSSELLSLDSIEMSDLM